MKILPILTIFALIAVQNSFGLQLIVATSEAGVGSLEEDIAIVLSLDHSAQSGDPLESNIDPPESAWTVDQKALEDLEIQPVPEPFGGLLILVGLCVLFMFRRRRRVYGG